MAIVQKPMIDDLQLTLDKDVANCNFTIDFTINWSEFAQVTNLPHLESIQLVGVDPGGNDVIHSVPILVGGISSKGSATTQRSREGTIPWLDLNEDPNGLDEIAAVVTLTPMLPGPVTTQSPQVVVTSP